MAELSDLITEIQQGNKQIKDELGFIHNNSTNSRRHLLEMKKSMFGLADNIAKMADVPPPPPGPTEGQQTEQRREDRKFAEKQLAALEKIAKGMTGGTSQQQQTGGGKGLGGLLSGLAGGLGIGAFAGAALKGAAGLVAMGVAIPAFFGGLLAGDKALEFMKTFGVDFNYDSLKAAALGFSDMVMALPMDTFKILGAIMAISVVGGTRAAKGLGTFGAGISAFLAGLVIGDALLGAGSNMGWLDLNMESLATAMKGFSNAILNLSTEAQVALGTLLVSGAVAGLVGKKPTDVGLGIAAFGAGISGFFIGLAVGDKAMGWLSADFSNIAKATKGFDDAIGNLTTKSTIALGLLIGAGAIFGKVTSKKKQADMVFGIGALSLGIAAFFTGFAGADFVAANVGDGGAIKNLVGNFADAIGQLDERSLTALGGLLAVGAVFGAAPGGLMIGGKIAIGMGVIGAGIAAFFVAFDGMAKLGGILGADGSATKKLVNNMIDGIKPLENMDGEKLAGAAKVLPDIGKGISAFFGGEMMGKLSETASDIAGFVKNIFGFGDDGGSSKEKSRIEKMVDALEPLKGIDPDSMKGLNIILDDLERLGKIRIQNTLGNNIRLFASGLAKAVPSIEAALYGGEVDNPNGFGNVQIKGLANGGQDFQIAVDALQQLMNAAQGTMLQGAVNSQAGGNVTSVDNSSVSPTTIVTGNGGGSRPAGVSAGVASGGYPHWMAAYHMQGANNSN